MVTKCYKRLNLLRAISTLTTQANPNVMLHLYKSIIRSIFDYCSLCIISAAETHIQKLQLVQNQTMRIISRTPAYVAIDDLHDCCGLTHIKDYLKESAKKKLNLMKRTSPLIHDIFTEFDQVKHITENASILDALAT